MSNYVFCLVICVGAGHFAVCLFASFFVICGVLFVALFVLAVALEVSLSRSFFLCVCFVGLVSFSVSSCVYADVLASRRSRHGLKPFGQLQSLKWLLLCQRLAKTFW